MNKKNKIITGFLFVASYFVLFIIWGFVSNALLVPWDGTLPQDRPALGSLSRTVNDYFEASNGSYWPTVILVTVSLLIVILRMKKQGTGQTYQVLDSVAVSNFLYIGLLTTLFFIYSLIVPARAEIGYSFFAIGINLIAIAALFFVQLFPQLLVKRKM